MIKKFYDWLVFSSANPQNVSLTVKGGLTAGAGFLLAASGFLGLTNITSGSVNDFTTTATQFVDTALQIVGLTIAAAGFIRKMFYTIKSWLAR